MSSKREIVRAIAVTAAGLVGIAAATAQTEQPKPLLAEEAFKNVQVLKGIPVDDFMQTMGLMTSALQFDCADCHVAAGTQRVDWAADTPRKRMARMMVTMVTNINKNNFGGRQMVTCFSCHHNRDKPLTTPTMDMIYGTPAVDPDDVYATIPGMPKPESTLDRYIQALGGADRLANLKSFDATGSAVGYGGLGGVGAVEIAAQAPDKRAMIIVFSKETGRGDEIRSFDGRIGWVRTPLNVLGEFQLSGGDLDGARFDAQFSFPGQIKGLLTNWKTGPPISISDPPNPSSPDAVGTPQMHVTDPVQGTGPRNLLVTLYFDKQTGLLLRELRYGGSPIGRVPTQIDYSDYRDVNGIKFPFRITYAWLDGRNSIVLSDIKTNVPIDQRKFGRPAPIARN
jgi:photosynthetic reaction center cytochrome c subunit